MLCCSVVIFLIFCVSCATKEEKAKRKFIKTIEIEFAVLKSKEDVEKETPHCQLVNSNDLFGFGELPKLQVIENRKVFLMEETKYEYVAVYREYTGHEYNYDIKKTNSVVTPYTGDVSFISNTFKKHGATLQECLDSDWKLLFKSITVNQNYAYQDGEWVLKATHESKKIKPVKE